MIKGHPDDAPVDLKIQGLKLAMVSLSSSCCNKINQASGHLPTLAFLNEVARRNTIMWQPSSARHILDQCVLYFFRSNQHVELAEHRQKWFLKLLERIPIFKAPLRIYH